MKSCLRIVLAAIAATLCAFQALVAQPDPIFQKPAPISMAELSSLPNTGVRAIEVNDFVYPGYRGKLEPAPPHADLNPKKAIIIVWKNYSHRLMFSHEATYIPLMMLPDGVSGCWQHVEANHDHRAKNYRGRNLELMNQNGRRERNSFVDIIESGPKRVWVRWTYFCVDMMDEREVALRATEDYFAYPNGLVWRRVTYESLMPDSPEGYSIEPLEAITIFPVGKHWRDGYQRDPATGDSHVLAILDAFGTNRYDTFRNDNAARRTGCDFKLLEQTRGVTAVLPAVDGLLFAAWGDASGLSHRTTKLMDHSFADTGGWGAFRMYVHWPVGWTNSQGYVDSPQEELYKTYPHSVCPFGIQLTRDLSTESINAGQRYGDAVNDRAHLKRTEALVWYSLMGVGREFEDVRRLARKWLKKGTSCAQPESIRNLK